MRVSPSYSKLKSLPLDVFDEYWQNSGGGVQKPDFLKVDPEIISQNTSTQNTLD